MAMELKPRRCRMCGETKSADLFYIRNDGGGRLTYCRDCMYIISREGRLRRKYNRGVISRREAEELQDIHKLYDELIEKGLRPPRIKREPVNVTVQIEHLRRKLEDVPTKPPEVVTIDGPLEQWLTVELDRDPSYYEQVSYALMDKWRPVIGYDEEYNPIYDESHSALLKRIDERFEKYEEEYWS